MGLAAWREAVQSGVPSAATAALLEQRPELPKTEDEFEQRLQANVLLDSVIARQAQISHQAARMQADLDHLARRYPALREHLATEIALGLGVAEATAGKYLDDAGSIRRLPATFAALDAGKINAFKATVIRMHTEHVSEEVARKVEQRVLPAAGRQTMPELREACTRAVLRIDPGGAEDRHTKANAGRGMSRRHLPEGMALLFIESAAQDIAVVFEACTALGLAARVKGDKRTADQRRMDALTDVCRDILDTGRWSPGLPMPVTPTGDTGKRYAGKPGTQARAGGCGDQPASKAGNIVIDPERATAVTPETGTGTGGSRRPSGAATELADDSASADAATVSDASDADGGAPVDAAGSNRPARPSGAAGSTESGEPTGPVCPRPPVILPSRGSRRPHIMVTVPAATLNGGNQPGNQPGYLAGHGPITAGQARTIAADGDLTQLICDPATGALLDYGRTRYRPPGMLRDFVHTRDRTCVTPGCRAPAARTDIDHITPYKPGQSVDGATDVDNLASLCRHHHRAKDGGGSRLRHHSRTGNWTWTTALGRTYTRPVVSLWEPADPGEERALRKTVKRIATPPNPAPTPPVETTPSAEQAPPPAGPTPPTKASPPPSTSTTAPDKTPPPF